MAAASFTSPPPMTPRLCKTTSNARDSRAATIEAATLGRPAMTRVASPSTATQTTMPSGMMRATISASAAYTSRATTAAVTRLTDHTSIAPGLTTYHMLAPTDGSAPVARNWNRKSRKRLRRGVTPRTETRQRHTLRGEENECASFPCLTLGALQSHFLRVLRFHFPSDLLTPAKPAPLAW